MSLPYIVIIGATASGKSALALRLAKELAGEIINCDSVAMVKGFDIGSAKPSAQEQESIPHHLLDVVSAEEPLDARRFADLAEAALKDIKTRKRLPLVVGGSGLYLRALWKEQWHDLPKDEALRSELSQYTAAELRQQLQLLDPERAAQLHPNDRYRLQRALEIAKLTGQTLAAQEQVASERNKAFVIYLPCERPKLEERIRLRTQGMLRIGLVAEVEQLLAQGISAEAKAMQSIGYASVIRFLKGELKEQQLEDDIVLATRQYAKRQETWFKKIKKEFVYNSDKQWDALKAEILCWWAAQA